MIGLSEDEWAALINFKRIEDMDYKPDSIYSVVNSEDILGPLIKDSDIIAVVGAFFGDEGKGKTIDCLSEHPDVSMVARANSGANAGHTVVRDGKEHIFHLTPSGILVDDITNYIGPECVMDPLDFMEELSNLTYDYYENRLFVGNVHIVTPYHKLLDILKNVGDIKEEDNLSDLKNKNVSTMQGISPVHSSKVSKKGPRLDNLFGPKEELRDILEEDIRTYYRTLAEQEISENFLLELCETLNLKRKRIPEHVIGFLKAEDKSGYLIKLYDEEVKNNEKFPTRKNVKHEIIRRLENGEKILIEGSQSYWLSNAVETHWSSSTSANTSVQGILASLGIPVEKKVAVINVHKYPGTSRVGRGANPAGLVVQTHYSDRGINTLDDLEGVCTDFEKIQEQFFNSIAENGLLEPTVYTDESGEYVINEAMAIVEAREYGERGATTKKPRVTGLFDCVAHAVVVKEQGAYTSISAVDRGDALDKVGVIIAYVFYNAEGKTLTSNGKEYKNHDLIRPGDEYPNENVLRYCRPIIKLIDGWKETPLAADKWDSGRELPRGVQELIGTIEHYTKAEVISIGNGTGPDNLIYLEKTKCLC